MTGILLSFLVGVIFWIIVFVIIGWFSHVQEVRSETEIYGWASYKKFKVEFNKGDWEYNPNFTNSLFEKGYMYGVRGKKDKYFADGIVMNSKGMIINNPISYFMSKLYVRNWIKKNCSLPKKDKSKGKVKEWY